MLLILLLNPRPTSPLQKASFVLRCCCSRRLHVPVVLALVLGGDQARGPPPGVVAAGAPEIAAALRVAVIDADIDGGGGGCEVRKGRV